MIVFFNPKNIQGSLALTVVLSAVLACSQVEGTPQRVENPKNITNSYPNNTEKQLGTGQSAEEPFELTQLPQYVFGYHVVPFMAGSDIHNFVRTAKRIRCAFWKELPFFFKGKERKQRLEHYLANPEKLIPIAAMALTQYILERYPSTIEQGSVILPSSSTEKITMVDCLAIKRDLFIRFLDNFKDATMPAYNKVLKKFSLEHCLCLLPDLLTYTKARLVTAIYNYLSLPNILKALHIPDNAQTRNDQQNAMYADFTVLNALQNPYIDDKQRQSAQKLLQTILSAGGQSWLSLFNFVQLASCHGTVFLCYGAESGHTEMAKQIIRFGVNINEGDHTGQTPLHFAAQHGFLNAVKFFLANHARIDRLDHWGATALSLAAQFGHTGIINILLAQGADINSLDGFQRTPLHYACKHNYSKVAHLLLARGADVHRQDYHGASMLHEAIYHGTPNLVKLLVEHGAKTNVQDMHRVTPLHLVAYTNHPQATSMAHLLLDNNADINVQDDCGYTPLMAALSNRSCLGLATLFIAYGANIRAINSTVMTALQWADYRFIKAQVSIWHSIMQQPPYDSEQAKYLQFLATIQNIQPSFRPPCCYATIPSPLTISPQDTFFVLAQHSPTHIKQMFGNEVYNRVSEASHHWQVVASLEKAEKIQR